MNRRAIVTTGLIAVALGLALAAVPGQSGRLSVDLWLIGVAAWAALSWTRVALRPVPVEVSELRPLLWFRRRPLLVSPAGPRSLLALESSILAAMERPGSHNYRLRPRLRQLAHHRLGLDHGIDAERDPDRAAEVMGAHAWLIDPDVTDRAPTVEELSHLADWLEPGASAAPTPRPQPETDR